MTYDLIAERYMDPEQFELHQICCKADLGISTNVATVIKFIENLPGLGKQYGIFVANHIEFFDN
jgi:hypothetical protein